MHNKAIRQPSKKTDRYVKAKILKERIKEYGIKKESVILVGSSVTDLPMAKETGVFIAFATKEKTVEDVAGIVIRKRNLREILKLPQLK